MTGHGSLFQSRVESVANALDHEGRAMFANWVREWGAALEAAGDPDRWDEFQSAWEALNA